MILCIAEKPSVAKDIANILGAKTRHDGYYEGSGYYVSWALGHLCCLKEPNDYKEDWTKWNINVLPIIPPHYEIKLINNPVGKKQFKILKELLGKCSQVINCGDAGQEGELIQRWILQQAKYKGSVKRLWISSLTDDAIRDGFKHLKDGSDYNNLYVAGMCRACGDWLLGMNATRLYTLKYGGYGNLLSIGRVQTPTLNMIVERDEKIENFQPRDYYLVCTTYRDTKFMLNSKIKEFNNKSQAQAIVDEITGQVFEIDGTTIHPEKEAPPQLFDLTSLQIECNKKFGYSADVTLKIAQALYELKVTTYPRTDSRYLTSDMYKKCESILNNLHGYSGITATIRKDCLLRRPKVFNDTKVTDHHAIIPTGQTPKELTESQQKVYDLICRRFISEFMPDAVYTKSEAEGHSGKYKFRATGKSLSFPGWKVLFGTETDTTSDSNDEGNNKMPVMMKGEKGPHTPAVVTKTTQPPKRYTDGTLLKDMETCGNMLEDEELMETLKENGIGRPSTRAAIIETLLKRGYIAKSGKNLISTPCGRSLIKTIKNEELKSPSLTGIWEKKLRDIEKGKYPASSFMTEIQQMVTLLTEGVKSDTSGTVINSAPVNSSRPSAPTKKGKKFAFKKKK